MGSWVLVGALVVAGCTGDRPAAKAAPRDAAPTSRCKPVPGCIPAEPTGDRTCSMGGVEFSCARCGPAGGLLQCKDTDGDGCVELLRTECGRPAGCETVTEGLEGARCKELGPAVALNQFGVMGPAGFVECTTGATLPVVGDVLSVRIRTRGMFVNPTGWGITVKGTGLDQSLHTDNAVYLDVEDDFGVLQFEVGVMTFDAYPKDVVLTYELSDHANRITQTCGPVSLARVEP